MGESANPRRWSPVDRAMLQLVRLVLEEDWHPAVAGDRLRQAVGSHVVLRQIAARLNGTMSARPSAVGERALLTVIAAMNGAPAVDAAGGAGLREAGDR